VSTRTGRQPKEFLAQRHRERRADEPQPRLTNQQIKVKIKVKVGIAPQAFIIGENVEHRTFNIEL
jgi:hypothetical protein